MEPELSANLRSLMDDTVELKQDMERVRGITKQLEGITARRVLELFEESKKITKSSCKEIVHYVEAF